MRVDHSNSQSALRGIWALLPTPFTDDMELDVDGFRRNINYIQGHDVSIYCVACGVGEPWSMTADEVVTLTETAKAELGDDPLLVVGVGDSNLKRATDLARRIENAGADMLMIMPPAYPKPEDAAIIGFYKRLAQATTLPFQIYPIEANPPFRFELVQQLLDEIQNIVSIKDVSHNVSYPYELHRRFGDRAVIVQGRRGETEARLIWFYAVGIQAYYSNIVNFRADLAVEHWEALERGDFETVVRIAHELEPYANLFPDLAELGGATRYRNIQTLKAVMSLAGLAGGRTRPPLVDLDEQELREIEEAVVGNGIVSAPIAS